MAAATGTAVATVAEAIAEQAVETAWKAYQATEHKGVEFGKACFEYRAKHGAQGVAGEGLVQLLNKLGCKQGKAYYWMNEYEVSIGVKERKEKVIKEVPTVLAYSKEYDRCAACGVESIAGTKHTCANPSGKWKPVKGWVKGFPPRTPFEMADYKVFETSDQEGEWTRPDKSSPVVKTRQESHRENVDNAKGWLTAYLEGGPRSTKPINYRQHGSTATTKAGLDIGRPLTRVTNSAGQITTTFAQAVKDLGIITKPTGKGGHTWELPKVLKQYENKGNDLKVLLCRFSGPQLVQAVQSALKEEDGDAKGIIREFQRVIKDLQGYVKQFSARKRK